MERLEQDTSFLRLNMAMTRTASKDEMIHTTIQKWDTYLHQVKEYFKQRPDDLLVFYSDDHPMNLYTFLNPIDHVYNYFEYQYKSRFHHRVHSTASTPAISSDPSISQYCDVYCTYLPQRDYYIRNTLGRFHGVHYVDAITPNDLRKKHYRKLSTTLMVGPMVTYCDLCNYSTEHLDIFHKFTKLCVHLSYLICLRHALEHSQKDLVLIFEDDIYFGCSDEEFDRHISEFRKSSFDVCYLGFCACRRGDRLLEEQDANSCFVELPFNQTIRCKHAIVYKRSFVELLLGELLPLAHNSDIQLNHANIRLKAKVAIPREPLVYQDRTRLGTFNENEIGFEESENNMNLPLY